ncbi:MAG: DUF11 domain-containing protein [Clostridia bacterium]|nr:DUF11 domain-containing protein [Clostridia bacterium]
MAFFTNQAQLTYAGGTVNSNVVVGEVTEVLAITKNALSGEYTSGETVTYAVNLINSGDAALTDLTITDNLGEYAFGTETRVPLTLVDGAVQVYANGVLQPAPTVTAGPPLVISDITVPANGNATVLYQAVANEFAPPAGSIVNQVTVSGTITSLSATETIVADTAAQLSITKSVSPVPVTENGRLTYTFLIQNTGGATEATDNIVLTDTFDPILTDIAVLYNGTATTDYTYDETTGVFSSAPQTITVPAATYTQDPVTGAWTVVPGTALLTVTGTV